MEKIEKFFGLKKNGTNVKTEVLAGCVTFLSMAYILAVNPSILSQSGMNAASVFTATAVSACFATLIMAFYANYPVALAAGMGLNAYFVYSVCVPMAQDGVQDPWQVALAAVLCEGIVFILLTLCKFREALVNDVPANLKYGISAGIGLFIAIVGFKSAGVVIPDSSTIVALGDMASPQVALALVGLLATCVMYHYHVPGYILWAILLTWGMGMVAQACGWYVLSDSNASLYPDFSSGFSVATPHMFAFNFSYVTDHLAEFIVIVFAFLFVDLFDTAGTLIAVAGKADLLDKQGNLPKAKQALMADALGTVAGACLGTSTVTSYVESSAGVAAGGRTGLTAFTTAVLFAVALFLSPIFLAIPSFATTPALVFVGLLMVGNVKKMDFEQDIAGAMGGYLALIMMPFTYSIANGIMFGILAFVIIRIFQGRAAKLHWVMWVASAIFIFRIATLVMA